MIIFICIIFSLFTLFVLAKDDFVFLRKNISIRNLFDIAIIGSVVGLFSARLVFIATHQSFIYLNPLVFLALPYFPGLSLSGFLLGSIGMVYILSTRNKFPVGRTYDFFSLVFLVASSIFFFSETIKMLVEKHMFFAIFYMIALFLFFGLFLFLKKILSDSSWKDGSIAYIVSFLSIASFEMLGIFVNGLKKSYVEFPYFGLLLFLLIISFIMKNVKIKKKNNE